MVLDSRAQFRSENLREVANDSSKNYKAGWERTEVTTELSFRKQSRHPQHDAVHLFLFYPEKGKGIVGRKMNIQTDCKQT